MKMYISIILAILVLITCALPAIAATTYVDTSWVTTTSESDLGGAYACMYKSAKTNSEVVKVFSNPTTIQIQFNLNNLSWVSAKCGSTTGYMPIDHVNYTKAQLRQALFGGYNLQRGFAGQPVKNLQLCLAALDYDTNGIDGEFGGGTQQAVKEFQALNKLTVDGIAGPNTQNLLIDEIFY